MPVDPRRLRPATMSVESLARKAQAAQEAERDASYREPWFQCAACGALLDHDVDLCRPCSDFNEPTRSGLR